MHRHPLGTGFWCFLVSNFLWDGVVLRGLVDCREEMRDAWKDCKGALALLKKQHDLIKYRR